MHYLELQNWQIMSCKASGHRAEFSKLRSTACFCAVHKLRIYWKVKMLLVAHRVRLFATPWTIACQTPLSVKFSRQEYWSGLPFPFPEDLPDPGIRLWSPALQEDSLTFEPPGKSHWFLWSKPSPLVSQDLSNCCSFWPKCSFGNVNSWLLLLFKCIYLLSCVES